MATIDEGFKLHVVAPDGELLETIELGGYDLTKPLAQGALLMDILDALGPQPS
tara:strand:+ start:1824 stop:1982 length:159 start_codon:yes stop_codon:yes gene_type:complete